MKTNNPRFKIEPVRFDVTGYVKTTPDEAQWWAVAHYQENVPLYGSGWFPAYVKVDGNLISKSRTKQGAQALLNLYCKQEGITLTEGERKELA